MPSNGAFISFEGIDGSGKSTQAKLLAEALRAKGYDVVETREPGGTGLGERVRDLLLDPDADIEARAELLLFSSARAQLVADVIRPALERGMVVIADRFFDSSTAYQGGGRGIVDLEWIEALHHFTTGGLIPDRTYLVDLDSDTASKRLVHRAVPDRMEEEGASFLDRARAAYLSIAAADPKRVLRLDGTRPIEALASSILADATKLINNESPVTHSE